VLDAGCGTGIYTRRLLAAGATVTGLDSDPQMLAVARLKAPSATLLEGDVTALPFADGTFDLSLAVTLLCFVEHPQRAVEELVRVTRPGGRVVLAELGRYSLWAAWRRAKGRRGSDTWKDAHFFTPGELAALLWRAGAANVRTRTAAYLPPALPVGCKLAPPRWSAAPGGLAASAPRSVLRGEVRRG
jgi:SAM-dependent methyltransferase